MDGRREIGGRRQIALGSGINIRDAWTGRTADIEPVDPLIGVFLIHLGPAKALTEEKELVSWVEVAVALAGHADGDRLAKRAHGKCARIDGRDINPGGGQTGRRHAHDAVRSDADAHTYRRCGPAISSFGHSPSKQPENDQ